MVTMSQIKIKSDLNGNYHVDSRVRNSEIHDLMSPQLLI